MKRFLSLTLAALLILAVLPASAESGYDAFIYLFQTIFEGETPYTSDDFPELIPPLETLEEFGTDQICIVTVLMFDDVDSVNVLGRNDQNELESCSWLLNKEEYSVLRLFHSLCKNWEELSPVVEPDVRLVFQFLYDRTDYPPIIVTNQEEAAFTASLIEQAAGDRWQNE